MAQRPRSFPRSLKDVAHKITRTCFKKQGFLNGSIIEDWQVIVGTEYKDQILPEKITFSRGKNNGGTLHVSVTSGGAGLLVDHNKQGILSRINTYYGYQALAHIQMKVSYFQGKTIESPKKNISLSSEEHLSVQELLQNINDNELKGILDRLGCAMILDKKEQREGVKRNGF